MDMFNVNFPLHITFTGPFNMGQSAPKEVASTPKEEPSTLFQRQRVDMLLAELVRQFPLPVTQTAINQVNSMEVLLIECNCHKAHVYRIEILVSGLFPMCLNHLPMTECKTDAPDFHHYLITIIITDRELVS